jgi:type II secretory pathway component GspD/PulD (secretin)
MRCAPFVVLAGLVLAPAAHAQEVAPAGSASRSIDCGVEEADLRDVMDEISRRAGHPIVVDAGIKEKVTVSLRKIPWRDAVSVIAGLSHCDVAKLGDETLLITQPPRVTLQFEKANARTMLQLLAAYSGKNMIIHPDVKGEVSVDMQGVIWRDGLASILKLTQSHAATFGSVVVVLPGAKDPCIEGSEDVKWPFDKDEADENPRVELCVEEADLSDVCAAVSKRLGVTVGCGDDHSKVTLTMRAHAHDLLLGLARISGCQLEKKKDGFVLSRPARVTLQAVSTSVKDFFGKVAEQANETIAVDEDVKGEVTLDVDNACWRDVVEGVALALDLRIVKDPKAALRIANRPARGPEK